MEPGGSLRCSKTHCSPDLDRDGSSSPSPNPMLSVLPSSCQQFGHTSLLFPVRCTPHKSLTPYLARVQMIKIHVMYLPLPPVTSAAIGPNILLSTSFSNNLTLCSSFHIISSESLALTTVQKQCQAYSYLSIHICFHLTWSKHFYELLNTLTRSFFACNPVTSLNWMKRCSCKECLWLAFHKVLGSNLNQDTGYPDWGVSWFSSVSPSKCWDSTLIKPESLSSRQPKYACWLTFDAMWSSIIK